MVAAQDGGDEGELAAGTASMSSPAEQKAAMEAAAATREAARASGANKMQEAGAHIQERAQTEHHADVDTAGVVAAQLLEEEGNLTRVMHLVGSQSVAALDAKIVSALATLAEIPEHSPDAVDMDDLDDDFDSGSDEETTTPGATAAVSPAGKWGRGPPSAPAATNQGVGGNKPSKKPKQAAKAAAKEQKKGGIQKKNAKDGLKKAARPGSKPS